MSFFLIKSRVPGIVAIVGITVLIFLYFLIYELDGVADHFSTSYKNSLETDRDGSADNNFPFDPESKEQNFKRNSYNTIGHQFLDIEKKAGILVNNGHYLFLDNLMDKIIENLIVSLRPNENLSRDEAIIVFQMVNFTEKEAEVILKIINKTLVDNNFVHQNAQFLTLTFNGRKLDADIKNIIKDKNKEITSRISVKNLDVSGYVISSEREKIVKTFLRENSDKIDYLFNHIDDDYYFTDCYNTVAIYLSIADILNLPLYSVHIPNHSFLRWYIDETNYFDWEATRGKRTNDYSYTILSGIKLSDFVVKNGVYFRKLKRSENFSTRFILLGNVMIQNAEIQNSDKKVDYYNKAILYFKKALASNPNFSIVNNNIGIAYEFLGDTMLDKQHRNMAIENYNSAIGLYRKAVLAYPESQEIRQNLKSLQEKRIPLLSNVGSS